MKDSFLAVLFSLLMLQAFAQKDVALSPYMPNKQERLLTTAHNVFKTNKYLNFKDKDVVRYYVDDSLYKQENLYDYFSYEKDWDEVAQEDTASYRKTEEQYGDRKYIYTDSTMTEWYSKGSSSYIWREMKIVLNPKAFILLEEEQISYQDKVVEIRSLINEYDAKNRVLRIINKTEKQQREENTQSIAEVQYKSDAVIITTEDGTIRCELSKDPNSLGYVSKLTGLETYDRFKYAIYGKRYKDAKRHATAGVQAAIERDIAFFNGFDKIEFGKGTSTHGIDYMRYEEEWKITFANGTIKKMLAKTALTKTPNGYKVNAFSLTEMEE